MKTLVDLLYESSLSRIWKHSREHDYGTITAFRYAMDCNKGNPYTKSENLQRNNSLKHKLLAKRYGVTPIKGSYIENYNTDNAIEVDEESFFVVDLLDKGSLKKDLLALGEEFEQDSIIFGEAGKDGILYGTNKCEDSYPGYGNKEVQGGAIFGKNGEFLSRVRGRPFVFTKQVEEQTMYKYPTELRGSVIKSKKDWKDIDI
jgi:hypothetical protein